MSLETYVTYALPAIMVGIAFGALAIQRLVMWRKRARHDRVAPSVEGWRPISTYPREQEPFGPVENDDWGPEVVLLMPACGEYPHGPVAVTGHLEAGMWLSRDAAEPACWGDLAAEPIGWFPLPPASGIEACKAEPLGSVHESPSRRGRLEDGDTP